MGMVVVTWLELRFRMRLAVPPLRRHVGLRLVRPRVVGVWPRWMSGLMGPSDVVGAGEGRWKGRGTRAEPLRALVPGLHGCSR